MWGVFLKKTRDLYPLRILPTLIGIVVCASGLLIYPSYTSAGIRNGLRLLGENIIPYLFPFMVLSTYIAQSSATELMSKLLHKPASIIWGVNGNGLIAVILGLIGGYPVGAKTVAEFYTDFECRICEKVTDELPNVEFRMTKIRFYWGCNPNNY